MSTAPTPLTRRLTAGMALAALPLAAAVGCGKAVESTKDSVETSLHKASVNLQNSEAASVVVRFDDPNGTLKKAFASGPEPMSPAQADLLLGGTISITIDPASGTMQEALQHSNDPDLPPAEQLKRVNVAVAVQADGGPVAQLRIVGGDVYANVSLAKISDIAKKGGSSTDIGAQVDDFAAQAPAEFQPLLDDVKAGKWIKLPLGQYADQLKTLGQPRQPIPSPSDPTKLRTNLLDAVKPFVSVTDASSNGSTRVLDVKVQAKQALTAALATFAAMSPALPGLGSLDTAGLDKVGDGTVNGQLTLTDDHLKTLTFDLESAVQLAPPGATPAPDVTGSTVTVDLDDSADAVTVPHDVSPVDVGQLFSQLLDAYAGARAS